jgi:hypothetical protein
MEMDMKVLAIKLSMNIVQIFLMCSLAAGQSETFQVVEPEKIPGILRTISNQSKQNFEKINTWQGELETSRSFIAKGEQAKETFKTMTNAVGPCPSEVVELTTSRIIFKCDLEKGLFYSKSAREEPSRYFDPADNRDLGTKSTTRSSSHIVNNEFRIRTEPVRYRKGKVIERKAIKEKTDADGPSCKGSQPAYLPKYLFDIDYQAWNTYPSIAETIEKEGVYTVDELPLKAEQRTLAGDLQYRIHRPYRLNSFGIKNFWMVQTFSTQAGYNMISWKMVTADGGKLMQQGSIEYQKINDVYVPIRSTKESYDPRDFTLKSTEETVFRNVRINEAIPAEIFTYKNLGLEDGEKIEDRIINKEFIYQKGELAEVTKDDQ